ncbi:MAG: tetratricopeptide repeat protein [Rhodobacteraceae bacterium]|nr:tetratricopeptide repeat protein [Paracoccaceae bacterium]
MRRYTSSIRCAVAAFLLTVGISGPSPAVADDLQALFDRLQSVDAADYQPIEEKIWREWSKSGSPAMDLLLKRGEDSMESDDWEKAIEHLTALTDHAPRFAQGFHARATAYYKVGKYGPALEDLRNALALEPRHFGAMSGLATIFEELGLEEEALEVYYEVRAIHPHRENLSTAIERLEKKTAGRAI